MSTVPKRPLSSMPVARRLQVPQQASPEPPPIVVTASVKKPPWVLILGLGIPATVIAFALMLFVVGVALQEYGNARADDGVRSAAQTMMSDFANRDSEAALAEMGLKVPPAEPAKESGDR